MGQQKISSKSADFGALFACTGFAPSLFSTVDFDHSRNGSFSKPDIDPLYEVLY